MTKKIVILLAATILLTSIAFAKVPTLTYHGTWYTYSFMWQNADFNDDTDDDDQHYYMRGDIGANADFGAGVSTFVRIGAWGTFGRHAITGEGPEGEVGLREAYLNIEDLFDLPLYLRVGKQHVLYGDQINDGGEDGFMGLKVGYQSDMFDLDLFTYRLQEGGGTDFIGTGYHDESDWNLHGLWASLKFPDYGFNINPYFFYRDWLDDEPMWVGLRSDGTPVKGLEYALEFTTMMGSDADDVDYKGMHYMGRLGYTLPTIPLSFGVSSTAFTGDDDPADDENNLYESPTWGGYAFDFYKDWPGFGPAHLLRTAAGFACLAPWDHMMTNLNVINANIGYTWGPLTIRADFFNYARDEADETDMGNEIALLLKYTYKETITFGGTVGYWMPGDYFPGEDDMIGGYIWTSIGF
ncbi:MAG: alginate export family protein [Candidatus Cloacimonadia bacterium]